jgi:hypothetical protein
VLTHRITQVTPPHHQEDTMQLSRRTWLAGSLTLAAGLGPWSAALAQKPPLTVYKSPT